jgi:hypothetical protein
MNATSDHLAVDDVEMIVLKVETGRSPNGQCYAYISGYCSYRLFRSSTCRSRLSGMSSGIMCGLMSTPRTCYGVNSDVRMATAASGDASWILEGRCRKHTATRHFDSLHCPDIVARHSQPNCHCHSHNRGCDVVISPAGRSIDCRKRC